jgi:NAD(P)-dependent dehydrogenase (short-subunit alcohol dehydrogenase family)
MPIFSIPNPKMSSNTKPLIWLITGCSSGFGTALSLIALKNGHKVIATSRNPSKNPELVKQVESYGGIWLPLDITSQPSEFQKVIDAGIAKFGGIDVLVNNAGIAILGPLEDTRYLSISGNFKWEWC